MRSASNVVHLYRDLPRRFDAWDIDSQTERREVCLTPECEAEILTPGGLYAEAWMRPAVSLDTIRFVVVLTGK